MRKYIIAGLSTLLISTSSFAGMFDAVIGELNKAVGEKVTTNKASTKKQRYQEFKNNPPQNRFDCENSGNFWIVTPFLQKCDFRRDGRVLTQEEIQIKKDKRDVTLKAEADRPKNMDDARKLIKLKKYTEAFKIVKPLSEKGNPSAQAQMGDFYYSGLVVEGNFEIALSWYEKAAGQGNNLSRKQAAYLLGRGTRVTKNIQKACFYLNPNYAIEKT
jgi:TPR repeat protein